MIIDTIGCIILKNNRILLGKRFDDEDCYAGVWDVPTGHVKELSPKTTVKREMKEELGIEIKKLKSLGSFVHIDETSNKKFNHIWFFAEKWEGEPKNIGELEKIRWFTKDEIKKLNIPKDDLDFILKFLEANL